jgi:hypothetical protein
MIVAHGLAASAQSPLSELPVFSTKRVAAEAVPDRQSTSAITTAPKVPPLMQPIMR